MSAGAEYEKKLNKGTGSARTHAIYDGNIDEWLVPAANVLQTDGGLFIYQKGTDAGLAKVDAQITVSGVTVRDMEIYGADTSTRPVATAVDPGTVFVAIDSGEFNATMSDGTNWVEV